MNPGCVLKDTFTADRPGNGIRDGGKTGWYGKVVPDQGLVMEEASEGGWGDLNNSAVGALFPGENYVWRKEKEEQEDRYQIGAWGDQIRLSYICEIQIIFAKIISLLGLF